MYYVVIGLYNHFSAWFFFIFERAWFFFSFLSTTYRMVQTIFQHKEKRILSVHWVLCDMICQHCSLSFSFLRFLSVSFSEWYVAKQKKKVLRYSKLYARFNDIQFNSWYWLPWYHAAFCLPTFGPRLDWQIKDR